jgi:hypothetical protein
MATPLNLTLRHGTTFGPVLITCKDSDGVPLPLAGYRAYAHARTDENSDDLFLDLAPVIEPDDADGLITLPAIDPTATAALASFKGYWDLVLELPTGERLTDPIAAGRFTVSAIITRP